NYRFFAPACDVALRLLGHFRRGCRRRVGGGLPVESPLRSPAPRGTAAVLRGAWLPVRSKTARCGRTAGGGVPDFQQGIRPVLEIRDHGNRWRNAVHGIRIQLRDGRWEKQPAPRLRDDALGDTGVEPAAVLARSRRFLRSPGPAVREAGLRLRGRRCVLPGVRATRGRRSSRPGVVYAVTTRVSRRPRAGWDAATTAFGRGRESTPVVARRPSPTDSRAGSVHRRWGSGAAACHTVGATRGRVVLLHTSPTPSHPYHLPPAPHHSKGTSDRHIH